MFNQKPARRNVQSTVPHAVGAGSAIRTGSYVLLLPSGGTRIPVLLLQITRQHSL